MPQTGDKAMLATAPSILFTKTQLTSELTSTALVSSGSGKLKILDMGQSPDIRRWILIRRRRVSLNKRDGMKYAVLFEKTSTGYSAHVPDLPGCVVAGPTFGETAELMR